MNLIDEILVDAKIIGGETYWDEQPTQTFAAWGERISSDGSDCGAELLEHECEVELYELMDRPDPEAHSRLQDALDAHCIRWTKEMRVLDLKLRLFMTLYIFSHTERR